MCEDLIKRIMFLNENQNNFLIKKYEDLKIQNYYTIITIIKFPVRCTGVITSACNHTFVVQCNSSAIFLESNTNGVSFPSSSKSIIQALSLTSGHDKIEERMKTQL
jgi:hypothetical protein